MQDGMSLALSGMPFLTRNGRTIEGGEQKKEEEERGGGNEES
jgi:hypothetical protein